MAESITTMVRRLVEKDQAAERAKVPAKQRAKEAEIEEQAVWDWMLDNDLTTFTTDHIPGLGRVQLVRRETLRAKVLDKDTALAAIKELGLADALIEPESIRQGPLNDYIREWIKNGTPIPNGLDFSPTRYVTITIKDNEEQE